MEKSQSNNVYKQLNFWFVVHFLADVIIAIPLFFFPEQFLSIFGWGYVDPIMARFVAAALFAIGIESYLGRNSDKGGFMAMLNLKIIWSFFAILGIALSLIQGYFNNQVIGWILLLIFAAFHFLWLYYRRKLKKN